MDYLLFGSLIYCVLGIAHMALTLFTKAFEPRSESVLDAMKNTHPRITMATSIWAGSEGFHLSHSLGMFAVGFFGLYIGYADLNLNNELFVLQSFLVLTSLCYLVLSITYWFILPTIGFAAATILFIVWGITG